VANNPLASYLKRSLLLKNPSVIKAIDEVDRRHFVREEFLEGAYEDIPLPIGEGQTISQPTTVAFMLTLLGLKPAQKVLDVGSGSGWTTALIAAIIGPRGRVYGTERVESLVEFGQNNLAKYALKNASISRAGEKLGLAQKAPFDRILVSAAAKYIPRELINQLRVGGVMVLPVINSVYRVVKTKERYKKEGFYGFDFVELK